MSEQSASAGVEIPDVAAIAEEYVAEGLQRIHCRIAQHDHAVSGAPILRAWSGPLQIFMQVMAAVAPAEPAGISPDDECELRKRAAPVQGEAWVANVVLGPDLELVGLDWWPLEAQ